MATLSYYENLINRKSEEITTKDGEIKGIVAYIGDLDVNTLLSSVNSVFTDEESGVDLVVSGVVINYEELAVISQKDTFFAGLRLTPKESGKKGSTVNDGGCGPSSMINGLFCALNYTGADKSQVAYELYGLFKEHKLDNSNAALDLFAGNVDLTNYPNVARMVAGTNFYQVGTKASTTNSFMADITDNIDGTGIYIGRSEVLTSADSYEGFMGALFQLDENGMGSSNIIITHVSAGTTGVSGAFRSGQVGHYVTISFNASEFAENGSFYLLDSLPRALEGESYGDGYGDGYTPNIQYDFVKSGNSRTFSGFNNTFNVERVQSTVIKVTLQPDVLAEYQALTTDEERTTFLANTYAKNNVCFWGSGSVLFDIN